MRSIVAVSVMLIASLVSLSASAVQPVFDLSPGWNRPAFTIDMTQFWQPAGLPDTGTNFYTTGAPLPGSTVWERFDPLSPFYQAWFGAYVVGDFPAASEWSPEPRDADDIPQTIANLEAITVVDQIAWLSGFGDPHPHAEVDRSSVRVCRIRDGFFRLRMRIATDSDVGDGQLLGAGGAPVPSLPFYPPFSQRATLVTPYAPVRYDAVILFRFDRASNTFLVIYESSAHWTLRDGSEHRTSDEVADEQAEMLAETAFQ